MQAHSRNYPITNQRSPHVPAPGRRNPGPPPVGAPGGMMPAHMAPQHHHQQQQQQAQQQAHMQAQMDFHKQRQLAEDAKRRAQKPVDKNLPPGVDEIAIGDGVARYTALQAIERRLDAVMMRKRLDIHDSVHRTPKLYRTMRISITNTVDNQPWQASGMDPSAFDFSSNIDATYRVKIQGRLLDDENQETSEKSDDAQNGTATNGDSAAVTDSEDNDGEPAAKRTKLTSTATAGGRTKLSHFFKSITINFDRARELQPDNFTQIEWKRPDKGGFGDVMSGTDSSDFDCLQFERKSDENINVTINLVRDEFPERYRLKKPLADLLDTQEDDRHGVLMGLWEYIKTYGLQADDETRRVLCDERLHAIFHTESLFFPQLPDLIKDQLEPLPPISLPYTIRVDRAFHEPGPPQATVYDIQVPVEDPLASQMRAVVGSKTHHAALRDLGRIDDRLVLLVQAMAQSKAKHDFFSALATDPANFIRRWISSQKRDLDVILGGGRWNPDEWESAEWRKGGLDGPWGSKEAWEGVGSYISRTRAGHDFK